MKSHVSFLRKTLLCSLCVASLAGCRNGGQSDGNLWQTGSAELDMMLDSIDRVEKVGMYNDSLVRATLSTVDSMWTHSKDGNAKAAALYARSHLYEIDEANGSAYAAADKALSLVDSARHPYFYSRLLLQKAMVDTALATKTATYFNVLPVFIEAKDSLSVVDTLWELNNAYEYVWDEATVLECFNDILKYVPDSMHDLKNIMRFNIVALERSGGSNPAYVHKIDSLRAEKELLKMSPPLGVLVYSDSYRNHSNPADLDTAGIYMAAMAGDHDVTKVYYAQKIACALDCGARDRAAMYASLLERYLTDDSPMIIETMRGLLRYYKEAGMTDKYDALNRRLSETQAKAEAYEKATKMAQINMQRQMRDFTRSTAGEAEKQHRRSLWIAVCGLVVVFLVVGIAAFVILRRRHRVAKAKLNDDLENTKRRLTVAQLRAVENEQTLTNVLSDLGNMASDHNNDVHSHAERIKVKLKAQLSGEDDWERFAAVFTEMRPGFVEKLKGEYPVLTQGDIRLCCLLSMGLDTKHIARLLLIRPESVKKHRQRLRAKLGLSPDVAWTDYFARF